MWVEDEQAVRVSILRFLFDVYAIEDQEKKKAIKEEFKSQNWRITPEASSRLGLPFVILGEAADLDLAVIQDAVKALQQ